MDTDIADISAPRHPPLPEGEPAPSPNLERTGLSMEFELLLEQLVNLHLSEVAQGTQQTSQYFTAATRLILQFFCSWQPFLRCVWFFGVFCFLYICKQFFESMWWAIPFWKCAKELFCLIFLGALCFLCRMFPALSAEWICIKDLSGSSPTCSCGIRDLRGSRGSATNGERQSVSTARNKLSLHSVDAEQILFAWQASELSSAVHEEVKESEPPRDPKFELGLHETPFLKHTLCIKMAARQDVPSFFKYEYWMILWMWVFFELCFSFFLNLNDTSLKLARY